MGNDDEGKSMKLKSVGKGSRQDKSCTAVFLIHLCSSQCMHYFDC